MAKTALQFLHNGREIAIFVDGGANLLTALRDLVGDVTPKFGYGRAAAAPAQC
jgi:carbon-monoxide dehydrogenase small subunit